MEVDDDTFLRMTNAIIDLIAISRWGGNHSTVANAVVVLDLAAQTWQETHEGKVLVANDNQGG